MKAATPTSPKCQNVLCHCSVLVWLRVCVVLTLCSVWFEKMGEQLICKLNPTSDLVKKQLSQLRDQWHTLKQTAANQTRALGGVKNLQEFNKKVDKLEAWIKEKVRIIHHVFCCYVQNTFLQSGV